MHFNMLLSEMGVRLDGITGAVVEQLRAACLHDDGKQKPMVHLEGQGERPEAKVVHVFRGGSTVVCDERGNCKHFSDYFSAFSAPEGEVSIVCHGHGISRCLMVAGLKAVSFN